MSYVEPPLGIKFERNEHGEVRFFFVDAKGVQVADFGFWPPGAEREMYGLASQMAGYVNRRRLVEVPA